jgi:hypothetical protein
MSMSPLLANALSCGLIENLQPTVIVPLLTQYLQWIVVDVDGNPIDTQEAVDKSYLTISVASRAAEPLTPGQETKFPEYGDWVSYQEPTQGKTGGVPKSHRHRFHHRQM